MLDSIYHMTLRLIKNRIFSVQTSRFYPLLRNVIMKCHYRDQTCMIFHALTSAGP